MTAPVVQLLAWKTLVWSEARNAKGEKGIMATSFNHTLNWVPVPKAESLFVRI
jgi:hypothetical protein